MIDECFGASRTRDDLFDVPWYQNELARADIEWPDDLDFHFDNFGWKLGLSPSAAFNTQFYLDQNEDVAKRRINPLNHFIRHGQFEGRRPTQDDNGRGSLSELGAAVWQRIHVHVDRSAYIAQTGHPECCDIDPVIHYFSYGHIKQRRLCSTFDNEFYYQSNRDVRETKQDPLIHYTTFGYLERRESAPGQRLLSLPIEDMEAVERIAKEFEEEFYYNQINWLRETTVDPVAHYYNFGAKAGLDPSASFSTSYYLRHNSDVAASGTNPFFHYLAFGKSERRKPTPTGFSRFTSPPTEESDFSHLKIAEGFVPFESSVIPEVYVLLPVYRGFSETLECLRSALVAKTQLSFKILILNDCSPDRELTAALERICSNYGVGYLHQTRNLGFVGNVNSGLDMMATLGPSNALLLNADTVVYDDWLDLMMAHLEADPTVATVTPMSNNATIMSYPKFVENNNFNLEVSHQELARLARFSQAEPIEVPTGVGFAMLISAAALKEVGKLDEEAFGKGYGEEVDFCRRCIAAGYRNIAAPNVFVSHHGSVSFAEMQAGENEAGQAVLSTRYPEYHMAVRDFVHGDPMADARARLDAARLVEALYGLPFMVIINHSLGGGIQKYSDEIAALAGDSGWATLVVEISSPSVCKLSLRMAGYVELELPNLANCHMVWLRKILSDIQRLDGLQSVIVNSLLGASVGLRRILSDFASATAHKLVYVVHDYLHDCPRANFVTGANVFCGGNQSDANCTTCLRSYKPELGIDITEWRHSFHGLVRKAARVFIPDESLENYLPDDLVNSGKVVLRPHQEVALRGIEPIKKPQSLDADRPLRVVVLGAIGPHKGSRILRSLRDAAKLREAPIEIHVVGYTDLADLPLAPYLTVHGRYEDESQAIAKIRDIEPDLALSLSTWPETYCYTLSILISAGLPIIGFDIGAQGTRLSRYSRGHVVDLSYQNRVTELLSLILQMDVQSLWSPELEGANFAQYPDIGTYLGLRVVERRFSNSVENKSRAAGSDMFN